GRTRRTSAPGGRGRLPGGAGHAPPGRPFEPIRLGQMAATAPDTIETVIERLGEQRYIGDRPLATAIFLALKLGKPLFIEGEAGVGKTEAAKVMADVLGARLLRLQCYEGIDASHAVYEWNYPRQLPPIPLLTESRGRPGAPR